MTNNENLIVPSSSLARKNGSKGGQKKAENAKLRQSFSALGKAMVDSPIKPELFAEIKDEFTSLEVKEITNRALMLKAQILKAAMGDSKAFEVIRDTLGEKPVDKQDIAHSGVMVANYSVSPATKAASLEADKKRVKIDE